MNNFEFHVPTRVYFGKGQICALPGELKGSARRMLIVTGRGSVKKYGIWRDTLRQVKKTKVKWWELSGIYPNPHLAQVHEGIKLCRREKIDFILGIGGGSVIDSAKAISAGAVYRGEVWDFFTRKAEVKKCLPVGTVLTNAAAGSELNGNMVITRTDTQQKLALGTEILRPVFSILDPTYTYSVNSFHTACGIVDIMVHIFEQYFSPDKDTEVPDRLAEGLMKLCITFGPKAAGKRKDYNARAQLMWASSLALCGLISKGKTSDWATHYIEHEVSALCDVAHGAGLAILSPAWMRYVLGPKTVNKFAEYAANVWDITEPDRFAAARAGIEKTEEFFSSLELPRRLRDVGILPSQIDEMARKASRHWGGSVGSFAALKQKDIRNILAAAF